MAELTHDVYMVYNKRMEKTKITNVRLSADGRHLLTVLADRLGITMTAVIEIAIRLLAKREGVE